MLLGLAFVVTAPDAWAQFGAVLLSKDTNTKFTVTGTNSDVSLDFDLPDPFPGMRLAEVRLRVVPSGTNGDGNSSREDQDVKIFDSSNNSLGGWSAYAAKIAPCVVTLRMKAEWHGGVKLLLRGNTTGATREYHGGEAAIPNDRPRLLLRYEPEAASKAARPPRSGVATDWIYFQPATFQNSLLFTNETGKQILGNPVGFGGGIFVPATASGGARLVRLDGRGGATAIGDLKFSSAGGAVAGVTESGHYILVGTEGIQTFDLRLATDPAWVGRLREPENVPMPLSVQAGEGVAFGPDGSVYLRSVDSSGNGRILGYNASFRLLWQTQLVPTHTSPLTLSADGSHLYALASISAEIAQENSWRWLRIDTGTGETESKEVEYAAGTGTSEARTHPALTEMLRPVVTTRVMGRRTNDFVFFAGNTKESGLLMAMQFDAGRSADGKSSGTNLWTLSGPILPAPPVLGVRNTNALYVVQGSNLLRYDWITVDGTDLWVKHQATLGTPETLGSLSPPQVGFSRTNALLVDGEDSIYVMFGTRGWVYGGSGDTTNPGKRLSAETSLPGSSERPFFAPDGTLVGYNDSQVIDCSPRTLTADSEWENLQSLVGGTIYSAVNVRLSAATPATTASWDGEVILKSRQIAFAPSWRSGTGSVLRLQSLPRP